MQERTYGGHNSSLERKKMSIGNIDTYKQPSTKCTMESIDCLTCKKKCTSVVQCKSKKLSNSLT